MSRIASSVTQEESRAKERARRARRLREQVEEAEARLACGPRPELLTLAEVAALARVRASTVYNWVAGKPVGLGRHAVRVGHRVLFRLEDVEAYLRGHEPRDWEPGTPAPAGFPARADDAEAQAQTA